MLSREHAPIPEPEVTPEMIEAGVVPLLRYHPDRRSEDDTVVEIFKAMVAARNKAELACE
jgi:hypothetical protein